MKRYLPLTAILFSILILVSCVKSASTTIEGKWNVVSDSTIISGGTTSYNIYYGNDADYFVFTNGVLYTREGSELDTFSYKLTSSNNEITLTQTGVLINAIPQTGMYVFTNDKIRIQVAPELTNPGFAYRRIINLKR